MAGAEVIRRPLVIVGAGPAGMAAAIAAAEVGVRPLLLDENPQVGGQIYRQRPGTAPMHSGSPGHELFQKLQLLEDRIEVRCGESVWAVFPPKRLAVASGVTSQMIEGERLILAAGAYEYVPPFPGWTLPGVMTPGGAQILGKTMGVRAGRRALVAGTGPFLLVVAEQLKRTGVEVVGIVEAARPDLSWRLLSGLMSVPRQLFAGLGFLYRLKRAGIPIHHGQLVVEARGDQEVRQVVVAPCDGEWQPDRSRSWTADVDTLCVGYGFVPRIELAQLAGCRLRHDDRLGGWLPEVDADLQTSVPGVWVAGDGGGVAGALVAQLEGELAGIAAARSLGAVTENDFSKRKHGLLRKLGRWRRFRAVLDEASRPRIGLTELAADDTVVCRCEELTRADIETGVAAGGTDNATLKVITRLGMGPCQGQMCWPAAARLLGARTGLTVEQIGPQHFRPPVRPINLGTLASSGT